MDVHSFAPIGLHRMDAAFDWLLIRHHCFEMKGLPGVQLQNKSDYISNRRDFSIYRKEKVLFQLKIRGASDKFKNQLRPLLRPRSVSFLQHFRNISRKTVPLKASILPYLFQFGSASFRCVINFLLLDRTCIEIFWKKCSTQYSFTFG